MALARIYECTVVWQSCGQCCKAYPSPYIRTCGFVLHAVNNGFIYNSCTFVHLYICHYVMFWLSTETRFAEMCGLADAEQRGWGFFSAVWDHLREKKKPNKFNNRPNVTKVWWFLKQVLYCCCCCPVMLMCVKFYLYAYFVVSVVENNDK